MIIHIYVVNVHSLSKGRGPSCDDRNNLDGHEHIDRRLRRPEGHWPPTAEATVSLAAGRRVQKAIDQKYYSYV